MEQPQTDEPISPQARIAWWWDPFSRRELRDEQAVFFADSLGPGTYRLTYRLRAAIPGTYLVMPATVSELYFPEVWGRSDGAKIQVASAQ